MSPTKPASSTEVPRGNLAGFTNYFLNDFKSGFLVFLIALPLCLGISVASGFPPIAGIFTAIVGALLTTFISNSEMTIKGPAAGMIVIVVGCVDEFAKGGMDAHQAYQAAIAVGVAAAVLQIVFGLVRAGILGEFFPSAAVHGMLAAIGVIIIIKQFPVALGVKPKGDPIEILRHMPHYIQEANPAIAAIGIVSLIIMFMWPVLGKRLAFIKAIPAPLAVLLVAIPMGMGFNLLEEHSYTLRGHRYPLGSQFLVDMPDRVFGMFDSITFPNLQVLKQFMAWKWVAMFFFVGTLESLLSAKAVDLIDPWKRKTNMNRDVLAVGIANLCAAAVGGLPMISEIVRSRANIDNGARTRFADFWHGCFLLLCVALVPMFLHKIPYAALAAMLVYTGSRLAHPNEFLQVYRIGKEQLAIFLTTLVVVLSVDLLVGIAAGIILKFIIHIANGVPLKSMFMPYLEVQDAGDNTSLIVARESAVFSNWIPFRRQIEQIGLVQRRNVIVDVSNVKLVDHSVIQKLSEMRTDFQQEGLTFEIRGMDALRPLSANAAATRKAGLTTLKRITITTDEALTDSLEQAFVACGASGFSILPCLGAGRRELDTDSSQVEKRKCVRFEVIASHAVCEAMLRFLRHEVPPDWRLTTCIESVDVIRSDAFERTQDLRASQNGAAVH